MFALLKWVVFLILNILIWTNITLDRPLVIMTVRGNFLCIVSTFGRMLRYNA